MNQDEKEAGSTIAAQLHEIVKKLTETAVAANDGGSKHVAVHICLAAMAGPLHIAAALLADISHLDEKTATNDAICRLSNPKTTMFAAILAAVACPERGTEEKTPLSSGLVQIIEAMDLYEKLTNEDPSKFLYKPLVEQAQQLRATSAGPLIEFLKHKSPPQDSAQH